MCHDSVDSCKNFMQLTYARQIFRFDYATSHSHSFELVFYYYYHYCYCCAYTVHRTPYTHTNRVDESKQNKHFGIVLGLSAIRLLVFFLAQSFCHFHPFLIAQTSAVIISLHCFSKRCTIGS